MFQALATVTQLIRRFNHRSRSARGPLAIGELKELMLNILLGFPAFYEGWLLREHQLVKLERRPPSKQPSSGVLRSREEAERSIREVESLGLPHANWPKDWDALIALDQILKTTTPSDPILDAGAELSSKLLPWLHLYGYRELIGNNLSFEGRLRRGRIRYERGDITESHHPSNHFAAIACLSVIEHDVDTDAFLREMARILRPKGRLIVSTDYSGPGPARECPPHRYWLAETGRYVDVPWRIFNEAALELFVDSALRVSLRPVSPMDFSYGEEPVTFMGQDYTFAVVSFEKEGA